MEKGLLIMVLTLAIVLMLTPFHEDKAEAFNGGTNSYTNLNSNSTYPSFSGGYATYSSLPTYGNFSGSFATYGSVSSNFSNYGSLSGNFSNYGNLSSSFANYGSSYGNVWNTPQTATWIPVPIGPGVIIAPSREPNPPDSNTGSEVSTFVSNPLKNPQWPGLENIYTPPVLPLGISLTTYPGFNTYPQIVNMLPQITYPNYAIDFGQLLPNFPNMPSFSPILPLTLDFSPYMKSLDGYPSIPNYF